MYDTDWAQRVYTGFCKDRTRTINIDNCIIQRSRETHYRHLSRLDVQIAIIDSISSPKGQQLWVLYKKLVKGKSFDALLLGRVSNLVMVSWLDKRERMEQLLLF